MYSMCGLYLKTTSIVGRFVIIHYLRRLTYKADKNENMFKTSNNNNDEKVQKNKDERNNSAVAEERIKRLDAV